VGTALVASLVATALALVGLGLLKGRVVGSALSKSGAQVLAIGGTSAVIGWLIGTYVPRLF
jgi:VIT1/CCC1 family predicted Fe2+/Mn2+ transporter